MNNDDTNNEHPSVLTARDAPCPCCGYCRHCGRSNAAPVYVPAVYPYPYWIPYYPPVYPPNGTVSLPYDGTITITNSTGNATGWTVTAKPDPQGEGTRWNYTAGQVQS